MEEKHFRFALILFATFTIVLESSYILKLEVVHVVLFLAFLVLLGSVTIEGIESQLVSLSVLVLVAVGVVLSFQNILQLMNIPAESAFSFYQFFKVISSVFIAAFAFLEWMYLTYPARVLE